MDRVYFKIPLNFRSVFEKKDFSTCDLGESISQYIELIIMTRYGEHRFDPSFGCEIWDLDFELILSESLWEEKLRQSLVRSISTHETRLYDVEVDIKVAEVEKVYPFRLQAEIKKKVDITVRGKVRETGEQYIFRTDLFLSPLSKE